MNEEDSIAKEVISYKCPLTRFNSLWLFEIKLERMRTLSAVNVPWDIRMNGASDLSASSLVRWDTLIYIFECELIILVNAGITLVMIMLTIINNISIIMSYISITIFFFEGFLNYQHGRTRVHFNSFPVQLSTSWPIWIDSHLQMASPYLFCFQTQFRLQLSFKPLEYKLLRKASPRRLSIPKHRRLQSARTDPLKIIYIYLYIHTIQLEKFPARDLPVDSRFRIHHPQRISALISLLCEHDSHWIYQSLTDKSNVPMYRGLCTFHSNRN